MMLLINKKMMDDEPKTYGYARDLSDIESAATGDLDVTELTENAINYTDSDHTEVGDGTGDASKIFNAGLVLNVLPGRHAAVKAAKDAYDDEAREEATESIVGE